MSAMLGMSARDRRMLISGGTSIACMLGIARGLPPIRDWQARTVANAAAQLEDRAAAQQAARALPSIRDSLSARRARLTALDSSLVSGPTPYAAASALASVVEDIADSSHIEISTIQLRADSARGADVVVVSVRLSGTTDVAGLGELLREIDGGSTLLRIAEISVSQTEPEAPPSKPEALRVELLVEALARLAPPADS